MASQYSNDRIAELMRQAYLPAVASPEFKARLRRRLNEEAAAIHTAVPRPFWKRSLAWGSDAVAMAIAIESILDAEIRSRFDEHDDLHTLGERLKRIIEQKSAEPLASVALLKELEDLARQLADILRKTHRPILESIADEVIKRVGSLSQADALAVATAIVSETGKMCLDEWDVLRGHTERVLGQRLTVLLSRDFGHLRLHVDGRDFVDRCIGLLKEDLVVSLAPAVWRD